MATNVQGSASSIGMAPAGAGMPATSGGAGGALPLLTAGAPAAGAVDPNAAAAGPVGGFDIGKTASTGRWLGPLLAVGGGIAALMAFKNPAGAKLLGVGGISAALSGVGLTAVGFKAKGIETGKQETEQQAVVAMQQLEQQYAATMQNLSQEATTQITTLQQQLAAAQQGSGTAQQGAGTGQEGQIPGPAGSGAMNVGPGLNTTVVPGQQQTTPVGEGQGQTTGTTTPQTTTPQTTTPAGPWSVQALVGQSVDLAAGNSASGTVIADAGTYRIEQPVGDPNGYATVEEANAAARQTMSTELMGSKFLRWMVVEHGGRFYGAIAKQLPQGEQVAPLTPQAGNVVAWSAMNHVSDNGVNGWQAYSWSQTGGAQSVAVPYGATNVLDVVSGGGPIGANPNGSATPTSQTPTLPGTNIPVPGATGTAPGGAVTGGDRTGGPFDPASQVGRSFAINASSTAEGDLARGGVLQVQKFVESSAGGFGTAEEAAAAARTARTASGGDQWTRWVSLQGADGRFYVYQGSIVKRPTAEVEAAPVHVFGVGFAEYFDGATNAWKAVRETQAA